MLKNALLFAIGTTSYDGPACLDRILPGEAERGRRGRPTADIDKLKDCTAAFLGALFSVPRHAWFRTAMAISNSDLCRDSPP
jgi:hypothetical protein